MSKRRTTTKSRSTSKKRTSSKSRSTSKTRSSRKGRQRVTTDSDTIDVIVVDHSRKKDGFAGTTLIVQDRDGKLTSDVVTISPQRLDSINVVDGKPGSVMIEAKARKKPFMVTSTISGTQELHKAMKDSNSRGFRGKDAEREVEREWNRKGWKTISSPSEGANDFRFQKGSHIRWVEVKEINETISSGQSQVEKGRVQLQQQHVKDMLVWEKRRGKNAKALVVVKVNYADSSTKYRQASAKEVWRLIRDKSDPVKLTWDEVQGFEKGDY